MAKFRARRACTIQLPGTKPEENKHRYVPANQVIELPDGYKNKHLLQVSGSTPIPEQARSQEAYVVDQVPPKETSLSEPDKVEDDPEKRSVAIQVGVGGLRKKVPSHWVKGGKVNVKNFSKMVGFDVTEEEIEEACPGFRRDSAQG